MDIVSILTNATFRDAGAIAIVVLVVLMILTDRLIPRGSHLRELEAAEKRTVDAVTRGNEWKDVAMDYKEINATLRTQNSDLIEANKIIKDVLVKAGSWDSGSPSSGGA